MARGECSADQVKYFEAPTFALQDAATGRLATNEGVARVSGEVLENTAIVIASNNDHSSLFSEDAIDSGEMERNGAKSFLQNLH